MFWWSKMKKRLRLRKDPTKKALRRRKIDKYMPIVLFMLGLLLIMCVIVAILFIKVGKPFYEVLSEPNAARDWILSYGKWSYLFFVSIVFLQVVIAILPGEPFQIAAGLAFGPWMGAILGLVGTLGGSITTFMLTRIFGYKIIELFFSERTRSKMDLSGYSRDSIERAVIIVFLIPGTPKDFLSYAVGLTPLPLKRWILITCMTRIAPIVLAAFTGQALNSGNMHAAAVLVVVSKLINLGVYVVYEIVHRYKKRQQAA